MSRKNDDRHTFRESAETAFYILLPLLCAAAILRGCRTWDSPSTAASQETASGQQAIVRDKDETDAAVPGDSEGRQAEDEDVQEDSSGGPGANRKEAEADPKGAADHKTDSEPRLHPYDDDKFSYSEETGNMTYSDENYESLQGIDVSDHQGEIDWEEVAGAGYKFVFVRVGFRGYGDEGTLNEDTMAVEYMREAKKAGLQVGAYFFSQAVSEEEAAEEARFAAKIIKKAGTGLDLPLVYDPELAGGSAVFPEKAGREIAARAAGEGYTVRSLLLSGEKAGGGYACHLRIGSGPLSPVIPEGHADLLLSDTPWEALRQLSWLKKDGQVITLEDTAAVRKGFPEEQYLRFLKRRVQKLTVLTPFGDTSPVPLHGNVEHTSLHFHDIFDILCNNPAPRA